MRVLLINPPNKHIIASHVPEYVSDEVKHLPPLGLLYIGTYLAENSSHSVEIFDALLHDSSYEQVAQKAVDYDLIGITTLTFLLVDVIETIKAIRRINNSVPIVLGGAHIALYPQETVRIPGVTFCLEGECDASFTRLVEVIDKGDGNYGSVPGLYWIEGGQIRFNAVGDFIDDLDQLPIPDRTLLEHGKYRSIASRRDFGKHCVTTAFSSRGCPYRCSFCDRPHLGKKFRAHSPHRIVDEITRCVELGIHEIFFYDDTFTVNRQRVYEICELILERNISLKWDIRARANNVNYDMLKLLKRAGCTRIHFGIESANEEVLSTLHKGITLKQATDALKMAKKAGIETLAYFMFGCPNETISQIQETLDFALRADPDYALFGLLTPFPGTPLYIQALNEGWFDSDYWREFAKSPSPEFSPKFLPNTVPEEELHKILRKSYRAFYLRPRFILREILKVRSWEELVMKCNMAGRILVG